MNHLAHALLSGPEVTLRVGGMMGDFVRGAVDPTLPVGIQRGIALHRAIDTFTDRHEEIRAARTAFEPPFRRYAGIFIDIWLDHLLARDFARWSATPLQDFSDDLVRALCTHDAMLPDSLRRFLGYMQAHDLPAAYADRAMIGDVLRGVSARLTRENPVAHGLIEITRLEPVLEATFDRFFPQLIAFSSTWRRSDQR